MKVLILTTCKSIDNIYGNTLTFKTIRVGFPNAEIIVYDNNSIKDAKKIIKKCAKNVNATFIGLKNEVKHHSWISECVNTYNEPIVICDPDMIFWENVEKYNPKKLLSGRFIPKFYDCIQLKAITYPRIHTCLLYIPEPKKLNQKIVDSKKCVIDFDGFAQVLMKQQDQWHFWDTLAVYYSTYPEDCEIFSNDMLNKFDHINNGTFYTNTEFTVFNYHHFLAKTGDLKKLKGLWKSQNLFYEQMAIHE